MNQPNLSTESGGASRVLVGFSPVPVYLDGLTNTLAYVFLAVKEADQYNGVVYSSYGTLKFYPNAEFWGITQGTLQHLGITNYLYSRRPYQGLHQMSVEQVKKVLSIIRNQRGVGCVVDDQLPAMFKGVRETSRLLHPATRGHAPALSALPTMESLSKLQGRLGGPVRVPQLQFEAA